jgi:DNA-binding XRE family transcriptional regulator
MLAIQPENGRKVAGRRDRGSGAAVMTAPPPAGAVPRDAVTLGAELRRLRLERGLSQRKLTQMIGLSAHSNLGEYERGTRVPPRDIVVACERQLAVPPGYLQRLQELALRERARARRRPPAPSA